ncbi:MAG: hypothetical protein AAGC58_04935 [Asticcacaulis sp.]
MSYVAKGVKADCSQSMVRQRPEGKQRSTGFAGCMAETMNLAHALMK